MMTRRDLLLVVAALAPLARPGQAQRRLSGRFHLRRPDGGGVGVDLSLERADLALLSGVRAPYLHAFKGRDAVMRIEATGRTAALSWTATGTRTHIALPPASTAFAASWAVPLLEHGLLGYYPAEDLPLLFSAPTGAYWRLPLSGGPRLPRELTRACGVYACFFGDYEGPFRSPLAVIGALGSRLVAALSPSAGLVLTTAFHAGHPPCVALTAFFGSPRTEHQRPEAALQR